MQFRITHETRYDFPQPVRLGAHRLMLRPRDSHELRLLDARLTLSPPAPVVWSYDVFGNTIGRIALDQEAASLTIVSEIAIERFARAPSADDLGAAKAYPPRYTTDDRRDLGAFLHVHDESAAEAVDAWLDANDLRRGDDPLDVLGRLMAAIRGNFRYQERYTEGTQSAAETLSAGSGTCRDFAMLMMEAARYLGFGARFATGYLYSESLNGGGQNLGSAATHAWAEIYLPGVGWTDYDPTNGIVNGADLIKIAVARKPAQAMPVTGNYVAPPGVVGALSVKVDVTLLD